MKLLFVTNLYPPHHIGGYALFCHEVAGLLRERGHEIVVLTSNHHLRQTDNVMEVGVHRLLRLESDRFFYSLRQLLTFPLIQAANRRAVQTVVEAEAPDLVVVWSLWNMSRQVAAHLEELVGDRLLYLISSEWPSEPSAHEAYWESAVSSQAGRLLKKVLRPLVQWCLATEWRPYGLELRHSLTTTYWLRDALVDAGLPLSRARVMHHGVQTSLYVEARKNAPLPPDDGPLRAVFVGTLTDLKGAHTAVEAIAILNALPNPPDITLDVMGSGRPEYERHLRETAARNNLEQRVSFLKPIPRAELPTFLAKYDVFTLTSIWDEPLARVSMEALAAGLVLIGTPTGGTCEMLTHEVNGLVFEAGDAQALAGHMQRLATNRTLRERLVAAGQETATTRFDIGRMIEELDQHLYNLARHNTLHV